MPIEQPSDPNPTKPPKDDEEEEQNPFETTDKPPRESDDDTTTTSTGGSSGGSSGPPMDTYISDQFKQDAVARQRMQMLAQIYMQIWGEPATEAYLIAAVKSGLNTFEFAEMERMKPAYSKTKEYRDKARAASDLLANLGVA